MPPVDLPIGQLAESKTNLRKHFDPAKLAELATSAKEHGILEPLLVRPWGANTKGGVYEIVAGARRFRAAAIAGLTVLPVRVMELTDEQVLEIQIIENLQREDPHPLEEAEGYARLIAMGHTADELALKVGKDRSYIYKRIQLAALIKPAKDAFLEGRINIGHAILICRLPDPKQKLAFEACYEEKWTGNKRVADTKGNADTTAKELAHWIREHLLLDLSAAPWKKDDAQLVPKAGPCTTCPKRTGANAALFDDFKKGDQCLDGDCYEGKREAFLKIQVKAHPELPRITLENKYSVREKLPAGVMCQDDGYELVKPNAKCASAEPAIVVAGDHQVGLTVLICRNKSCKTHAAKYGTAGSGGAGKKQSFAELWADRKKKLTSKIEWETRRRIVLAIIAAVDSHPSQAAPELRIIGDKLIGDSANANTAELLGIEVEKKKGDYADYGKAFRAELAKRSGTDLIAMLVGLALADAVREYVYREHPDQKRLRDAAEAVSIDWTKVQKATSAELTADFEQRKAKAATKKAAAK